MIYPCMIVDTPMSCGRAALRKQPRTAVTTASGLTMPAVRARRASWVGQRLFLLQVLPMKFLFFPEHASVGTAYLSNAQTVD
jgi:hypothetical protein